MTPRFTPATVIVLSAIAVTKRLGQPQRNRAADKGEISLSHKKAFFQGNLPSPPPPRHPTLSVDGTVNTNALLPLKTLDMGANLCDMETSRSFGLVTEGKPQFEKKETIFLLLFCACMCARERRGHIPFASSVYIRSENGYERKKRFLYSTCFN